MDETTVFLIAQQVPWREATGLMENLENFIMSLNTMFGMELCLFLILHHTYYKRMDLQITGRTVMGLVDSSEIAAMFNLVD